MGHTTHESCRTQQWSWPCSVSRSKGTNDRDQQN
jgi:hypothetical protein